MLRTAALVGCLVVAGVLAWAASRTPAPLAANAPPLLFSAERAYADIEQIGVKPHPSGSAEHDRVRDYLLARCKAMGLETHIQAGEAVTHVGYANALFIEGGDDQDVVCVLPGRDRSGPAIALMAHYDTVPGSPGAADDSANVAVELEIARAIQASGVQPRDVVFLFTDGEEGGSIGARLFFNTDPLARRIGAVINMEAEGSGGRAIMFETGRHDGPTVGLFRRTADNPTASSLAGYLYAHMPNGTDFTVTRDLGYPGLNFAYLGEQFDYHSPSSTPPTVQLGSVQHMGQQVLSATRGLLTAKALPGKGADAVYDDLMGGVVIAYPALLGWLILFADGAILYYAFRKAFRLEPFGWFSGFRGAAAIALILPVAGVLLYLMRRGTGAPSTFAEEKALLAQFGLYEAGLGAACLAGLLLTFLFVGMGRSRFWSAFAGACALGMAMALALQVLAPPAAFVLTWPLLFVGAIAWLLADRWDGERLKPSALVFVAALATPVVAQLIYIGHPIALAVGADLPFVLATPVMIAALALFPLLWPAREDRPALAICAFALLGLVFLDLYLRLFAPWSPRHPRPIEVVYVEEANRGRFLRASPLPELEPWTKSILEADGAPIRLMSLAPFAQQAYVGPGWPVSVPRFDILEIRKHQKTTTLRITPGGESRDVYLEMQSSTPITGMTINGLKGSDELKPDVLMVVRWHAARQPLTFFFNSPLGTTFKIRYAEVIDGWPSDAPPLQKLPDDAMAWADSGSTVVVGATRYKW
jgi:hypothetical protein